MKKQIVFLALVCLMAALLLCGCAGQNNTPADNDNNASSPAETVVEDMDLEALYQAGMDSYADRNMEAPILFPENNLEYFENFYTGISEIEFVQFCGGIAPVTNAPFEVILTEVKNEADVQKLIDIFQARVDYASDDDVYPEESAAWKNNTKITSRGNYVFLAVMTDEYGIPEEFILD